ncbi:MAG TPA: heme biosynthesis HemY N-terminal domain-containing protein [Gammaproteobacteria bacterium]
MRVGVALLVALFVGAVAAHFMLEDRGYVLIDYRGYLIEMSVPALVFVLVLLYLGVRGVAWLWRAPHRLGVSLAERRHRNAGRELTRGLMHLADGNWAKGERLLLRGARASDAPLVHYLMAARAAQQQGSTERRDEWLRIASEALPEAEKTVLLTQAELQLATGEHARALDAAKRVLESSPEHPVALALAARACSALGERAGLADLVPKLHLAQLPPADLERLAAEGLDAPFGDPDLTSDALAQRWGELPREIRRLPRVVALRALALERLGRGDDAERELRAALKRAWDPLLIDAYGKVRASDAAKQLKQAETWLRERPEDAALLVCAARLCIANELWGKARSYLESSIAIDPAPESYALYGNLLDRLGENERAALAFRSGLALVDGRTLTVPALEPPAD